jgi:hypothetical protein
MYSIKTNRQLCQDKPLQTKAHLLISEVGSKVREFVNRFQGLRLKPGQQLPLTQRWTTRKIVKGTRVSDVNCASSKR